MKRAFLALIAALAFVAACDRPAVLSKKKVHFSASAPQTRTVFTAPEGDSYPVVWTAEDRSVSISLNGASPVEATVEAAPDGRTAKFKASFTDPGAPCTFRVLSPASACIAFLYGKWAYNVPTEQTSTPQSVDPAAMILAATSATTESLPDEVALHFEHLTAYGCLTLLHGPRDIRSVQLSIEGMPSLTIHTTSTEAIWFGLRPGDVSDRSLLLTVETAAGTHSKSFHFPEGRAFEAGKIARFSLDLSGATFQPRNRSISVLAIGNSFSWDAMEYLFGNFTQAGYRDVFLGNLYIGGCSLQTHAGHLASGAGAYEYRTNNSGYWTSTNGYSALDALSSRNWDYITLQQVSGLSGMPDSYEPYLSDIIRIVRERCPGAKLLWHQTWAYQANSSHSDFAKYGNDQMQMYDAIVGAVQSKVLTHSEFEGIIPSGTAIQNLRTSFLGDNLTRDGFHMSYDVGRTATALTWFKQLTGRSLSNVSPSNGGYSLTEHQVAAIKEAVENAYDHPLSVTAAEPTWNVPDPALRQQLSDAGYNPANYRELAWTLTPYAFYNSTGGSGLTRTASNSDEFAATQFFQPEDLPAGSVLVLKNGYQYRPEKWTSLSEKTTDRPGTTTTPVYEIPASWWSGITYRAFNLSKAGNPHLSDAEMESLRSCFAIFVPVQ